MNIETSLESMALREHPRQSQHIKAAQQADYVDRDLQTAGAFFKKAPTEIAALPLDYLSLHEISAFNYSVRPDKSYRAILDQMFANNELASSALRHTKTVHPNQNTFGFPLGFSWEHPFRIVNGIHYRQLVSTLHDPEPSPKLLANARTNLRKTDFHLWVLAKKTLPEAVAHKLISALPKVPKEDQKHVEEAWQAVVKDNPILASHLNERTTTIQSITALAQGDREAHESLVESLENEHANDPELCEFALKSLLSKRALHHEILVRLPKLSKSIEPEARRDLHATIREFSNGVFHILTECINYIHLIPEEEYRASEYTHLRLASGNDPELLQLLAVESHNVSDPIRQADEHAALRIAANGEASPLYSLAIRTHRIKDPKKRAIEHAELRKDAVATENYNLILELGIRLNRITNKAQQDEERRALIEAVKHDPELLQNLEKALAYNPPLPGYLQYEAAEGNVLVERVRFMHHIEDPKAQMAEFANIRIASQGDASILNLLAVNSNDVSDRIQQAEEHAALRIAANGEAIPLHSLAIRTHRIKDPKKRAIEHAELRKEAVATENYKLILSLGSRLNRITNKAQQDEEGRALIEAVKHDPKLLHELEQALENPYPLPDFLEHEMMAVE